MEDVPTVESAPLHRRADDGGEWRVL